MKPTAPSLRRLLAAATGLIVGVGGALAVGAGSGQAQEAGTKRVVNCQTLVLEPDREGQDSVHAWRVVLKPRDTELDEIVLWQSGDWAPDDDLGTDIQALIDKGWTVPGGPFTIDVDIEDAPKGYIFVQWWTDYRKHPSWWNYQKWEWKYENPCGKVGKITVTQPTCDNPNGIFEVPDPGEEEVTYRINGEVATPGPHEVAPDSYEITALRIGGVKNYAKNWDVVIPPPDCPTPQSPEPTTQSPSPDSPEPSTATEPSESSASPGPGQGGGLPVTGAQSGIAVGIALALLAVGGGLYFAARRRRIRFTA